MDSHILKLTHCLRAVFLDDVRHGDDAKEFSILCEEQRRLSFLRQLFRLPAHGVCDFRRLADVFQIASGQTAAVQLSGQAAARHCLEIRHFQIRLHTAFPARLKNRVCQRMLALLFQGIGQGQELFL